jgi:hypothetical protein
MLKEDDILFRKLAAMNLEIALRASLRISGIAENEADALLRSLCRWRPRLGGPKG